jgi:hypothetical protein
MCHSLAESCHSLQECAGFHTSKQVLVGDVPLRGYLQGIKHFLSSKDTKSLLSSKDTKPLLSSKDTKPMISSNDTKPLLSSKDTEPLLSCESQATKSLTP